MTHKKTRLKTASQRQREKYAEYLTEGEEIVAVFGIGDRYFWINAIPLAILSVPLVGLPFFLKLLHLKHKLTYILTDRRVLIKDGVFTIKTTTAPYDKITHITVSQDFFERVSWQTGDITIHTAGPTPVEIDLIKVQDPLKVKNLIEELTIKERTLLKHEAESPVIRPFT